MHDNQRQKIYPLSVKHLKSVTVEKLELTAKELFKMNGCIVHKHANRYFVYFEPDALPEKNEIPLDLYNCMKLAISKNCFSICFSQSYKESKVIPVYDWETLKGSVCIDEIYQDEVDKDITLYYSASKEFLNGKYPEAYYANISVSVPQYKICAKHASVSFSPVKQGSAYDWYAVDLPYEYIDELLELAGV